MSNADDILFEPIAKPLNWRKLTEEIIDYITIVGNIIKPMPEVYALDRDPPTGALTLLGLMERYYIDRQDRFYVVVGKKHISILESFPFDGRLEKFRYEEGKSPLLGSYHQLSIRDLNLVPNTYTRHYVFAKEDDARNYMKSLRV